MRSLFSPLLFALVTFTQGTLWAQATQERSPKESPSLEPQPDQPVQQQPARPPRVLGQAQTQEEFDAWSAVVQAVSSQEKIELGKKFLEQYRESGLSPFVHRELALAYYENNDEPNFMQHAEETLREIPNDATVLPALARAYAERGETNRAGEKAREALESLQNLERPIGAPVAQWMLQRDRAMADAHYAHGLVLLRQSVERSGDQTALLKQSTDYFEKAVGLDPSFEYAYFRLGSAYARLNDAEGAVTNFARVAALEGLASSAAREQVQRIYEILKRDSSGIEPLIEEQRRYIQNKMAEQEAALQKLEKQEAEKQRQEQRLLVPPPPVPN